MKKILSFVIAPLFLTACFSGSPTEQDIKDAIKQKITKRSYSPRTLEKQLAEIDSLDVSFKCKEIDNLIDTYNCNITLSDNKTGKKEDLTAEMSKNNSGEWAIRK